MEPISCLNSNEMIAEKIAIRTIYFSIIANTVLALVKGLAGFFGNSHALIADAIESTTDIVSSFLILLGFRYAKRPADENHPYGHGKIEDRKSTRLNSRSRPHLVCR